MSTEYPDLKKLAKATGRIEEKEKYSPYNKLASKKKLSFFRVEHTDGTLDLIPYNLLGMISYQPRIKMLLLPMAGQVIIVQGNCLDKLLLLLQTRELEFIRVKPAKLALEKDQPFIHMVLYQKLVESQISDAATQMEALVAGLQKIVATE